MSFVPRLKPFLFLLLAYPLCLHALDDYRAGAAFGFGGTGVTQAKRVGTSRKVVERSEGPGVASIFIERLISDNLCLGIEHARGFSLGPFSTGESFTGLAAKRYFLGPAPTVAASSPEGGTLFIKRYALFAGGNIGVATASISRDTDQVPNVAGSGVFVGVRFGADMPVQPGLGMRFELVYNMTLANSDPFPSQLKEFALQWGLYSYF